MHCQHTFSRGCFLKWRYPQNTAKWSFLVGKPMVVGYHLFRKPPYKYPSDLVSYEKPEGYLLSTLTPTLFHKTRVPAWCSCTADFYEDQCWTCRSPVGVNRREKWRGKRFPDHKHRRKKVAMTITIFNSEITLQDTLFWLSMIRINAGL